MVNDEINTMSIKRIEVVLYSYFDSEYRYYMYRHLKLNHDYLFLNYLLFPIFTVLLCTGSGLDRSVMLLLVIKDKCLNVIFKKKQTHVKFLTQQMFISA